MKRGIHTEVEEKHLLQTFYLLLHYASVGIQLFNALPCLGHLVCQDLLVDHVDRLDADVAAAS